MGCTYTWCECAYYTWARGRPTQNDKTTTSLDPQTKWTVYIHLRKDPTSFLSPPPEKRQCPHVWMASYPLDNHYDCTLERRKVIIRTTLLLSLFPVVPTKNSVCSWCIYSHCSSGFFRSKDLKRVLHYRSPLEQATLPCTNHHCRAMYVCMYGREDRLSPSIDTQDPSFFLTLVPCFSLSELSRLHTPSAMLMVKTIIDDTRDLVGVCLSFRCSSTWKK